MSVVSKQVVLAAVSEALGVPADSILSRSRRRRDSRARRVAIYVYHVENRHLTHGEIAAEMGVFRTTALRAIADEEAHARIYRGEAALIAAVRERLAGAAREQA
jgi:chromosomal replication initiation ATPase DnaA